jgi:hypothetical protein
MRRQIFFATVNFTAATPPFSLLAPCCRSERHAYHRPACRHVFAFAAVFTRRRAAAFSCASAPPPPFAAPPMPITLIYLVLQPPCLLDMF